MKKYIYSIMAAVALFCTSCEQDLPVYSDPTARLL